MILPSLLPQIVHLEKLSPQKAGTKYMSPTLLRWPPWGTWVTDILFTWLHSLEAFPSPTHPSHSHTRPCSSYQPRCLGPCWYAACPPELTGLGRGAGNHSPAPFPSHSPCCHTQLPICTIFPGQASSLPHFPLPQSVVGQSLQPAHIDALLGRLPLSFLPP